MVRVFFSVGDASGDMYAAEVAKALKRVCPDWQLEGIGGSEMLKAGIKLWRYTTPFSAFGFWSSVQNAIRFWLLTAKQVRSRLLRNPPDLFVPVDLGAFNRPLLLPLAQKGVKVFYLVPPSFWGVDSERLKKYAHSNIVFAPIYEWQRDKLQQAGAQVIEFGHPIVDILRPYLEVSSSDARTRLRLPLDKPVIGLFPGSRLTTVKENLPLLLKTAEQLNRSIPKVHFAIGLPEGWRLNWVKANLERYGRGLPFSLLFGQSRILMRACDVAILVAGTVTLEAACLGTPSVAVFWMGFLNRLQVHWLRWKGVNVLELGPFALPNRILGEIVMPEFVGWMAKPERIATSVERLLNDKNQREQVRHRLTKVWNKLGEPKVGLRIANFLVQWLSEQWIHN
ncbi:MAG: hypothetical protein N3B10_09445 [Armatimonadetes bacterium]|nr:hypothetical protein [Armatimonadota bacterium]